MNYEGRFSQISRIFAMENLTGLMVLADLIFNAALVLADFRRFRRFILKVIDDSYD